MRPRANMAFAWAWNSDELANSPWGRPVSSLRSRPACLSWIRIAIVSNLQNADGDTFQSLVLDQAQPVVVDFWGETCGACKMLEPILERIANELAGEVNVVKVNAESEPEIAAQYGVRGLPTLIMFRQGEAVANRTGAAPQSMLTQWIRQHAG